MSEPEGSLTSSQFEILQLLWDRPAGTSHGLTVSEIWEEIYPRRQIARTTVLNLVDRLEKRGWLEREKFEGFYRYRPAMDRAETEQFLAVGFVDEFFAGSASNFLLSLLGSNRPSKAELRRLRELLEEPPKPNNKPKE